MGAVSDDQLAIGVADVVGELATAPGRVDTHRAGAHQGRAGDPEQEFRDVVEEDADVEGPLTAEGESQPRPDAGGVDELRPGVALVLEEKCRVVVTGPRPQQIGDGCFTHVPLLPGIGSPAARGARRQMVSPPSTDNTAPVV